MILAHRELTENGNVLEQTLEYHLYATGDIAGRIGKEVGLEAFMKLAGYLHDIGKADRNFQNYIYGKTKQQVNHSSAGGRILDDFIQSSQELLSIYKNSGKFQYFQEILTYIILAHHGLYDIIPYGESYSKTYQRLLFDKEGGYYYREDVMPFAQKMNQELIEKGEKSIVELIKEGYEEFELIYSKLVGLSKKNDDKTKVKEEKEYYVFCITRLCLSILKEADIYDSANAFHNPKQYLWGRDEKNKIWEEASEHIESMYKEYESALDLSELNKIRNHLANLTKRAGMTNRSGIFKLSLPTGAGKTKASLRYALANAKEFQKNRIFYITAYLSVLEQNAAEIRDILNMDEVILEHHSNTVDDRNKAEETIEDIEDYGYQTYLRDSWESPIILTTMVQFFNTLFKDRSSNIRRFCKLINSVIIIDEVQSLPLKVISNFNLMMSFMKGVMNCSIVHCTATQPVLDNKAIPHPIYYGNENDEQDEIVIPSENWAEVFQRVDFFNLTGKDALTVLNTEDLSDYILNELQTFDSCLVVLNTKSAVFKLYDYLSRNEFNIETVYLTTNMCAAHRLDTISELKRKLLQNRNEDAHHKIICISTQLIEAGVDLDFDIVFRSLAGIDSLVQCAGRCNREGRLKMNGKKIHGKLFIIRYVEENLSNLPDIKASADASEYALRSIMEKQDTKDNRIVIGELQLPYFNKYYVSNQSKMDYYDSNRKSSMIEELGKNEPDRNSYAMAAHTERKPKLYQAFRRAAENFQLIDQGTKGVLVPYKNQELLKKLEEAMDEKDYDQVRILLRMLQRYTINVYITPKLEPFIYKNEDFNLYFLSEQYYDENIGIVTEQLADLIL